MSVIFRDARTGKVSMASILTIEKNRRTLLYPQMIDITDAKDINEIAELIIEFEKNYIFQKSQTKNNFRIKAERIG